MVEAVDLEGLILQVDLVDLVEQEMLEAMVMVEMLRAILEVVVEADVELLQIREETVVQVW